MYEIVFSQSASQTFSTLTDDMRKRVVSVLERISVRPYSFVRRLRGSEAYRLRIGKYRLIMDIEEKTKMIEILVIGHRDSIYEKFSR